MNWMVKWAGPFPLFLDSAAGAHATCADGHDYVDLCLGDTGRDGRPRAGAGHRGGGAAAPAGHHHDAPDGGRRVGRRGAGAPIRAARRGSSPSPPTDANRFSLRIARAITGRPLVAVHEYCYHGSVDETFAVLAGDGTDRVVARRGNLGPQVDPAATTRVVPFNDLEALDRALADGQVAALLIEPALTNVGIVLPDPGYLEGVRELTRRHGTILIHDETHTICAGPGGVTGARRLRAGHARHRQDDRRRDPGRRLRHDRGRSRIECAPTVPYEDADVGGIGGTLAGYALSMAAARAALGEVLTAAAFERMLPLAARWERGVDRRDRARTAPPGA